MKLSVKAQASMDKVLSQFQAGDLSAITTVARIELSDDTPAKKWSFGNKVLAYVQTNGELDCRGFKQWQSFGRQVKKGSRAAWIFRPRTIKKKKDNDEEYYQCVGFTPIPVFSAKDTEGDTPLPDYIPAELPPLMDVADRLGVNVSWQPVSPDELGDCDISGDNIRIGTEDASVFFHELAHAAHAKLDGKLQGGQHTEQETVAEFTATVLMELYGIRDHTGNAWKYIKSYASDPLVAIQKALGTIEKVLVLLTGETKEAPDAA